MGLTVAVVADFLTEARLRSHDFMWALEQSTTRHHSAVVRRTGLSQPRIPDSVKRDEARIREGWAHVAQATYAVMNHLSPNETSEGLHGLRQSLPWYTPEGEVAPDSDLRRVAECIGAVSDLTGDMPPPDRARVRGEVMSVAAHTARACAAGLPRRLDGYAERLDHVAALATAARGREVGSGLGAVGLRGVPESSPLAHAVEQWKAVAGEWSTPGRVALSPASAREVARTGAHISAAAQRACLAQGPDMRENAEQWKEMARAWLTVDARFNESRVFGGGARAFDPEVQAVGAAVLDELAGEFRDGQNRWVVPDRLAAPEELARFERDARAATREVGQTFSSAITTAVRSEMLVIHNRNLGRPGASWANEKDQGTQRAGIDPARRLSKAPWVTLPHRDPAAVQLTDSAREVGRAAALLPPAGSSRLDRVQSSVSAAFPYRSEAPRRPESVPGTRSNPSRPSGRPSSPGIER